MCVKDKPKIYLTGCELSVFLGSVFNSVAGNGVGLEFGGGHFSSLGTQM